MEGEEEAGRLLFQLAIRRPMHSLAVAVGLELCSTSRLKAGPERRIFGEPLPFIRRRGRQGTRARAPFIDGGRAWSRPPAPRAPPRARS
jgi:hypothetical protein